MPKKNIDYSKTVIYKIVPLNLDLDLYYVGCTTNFKNRKYDHRKTCNSDKYNNHNLAIYQKIRDNGGWDAFQMIEIEKYPCQDGNEARQRERYWYEKLGGNLNTVIPSRTRKQYYKDNRDILLEQKKKYVLENKEVIKQRQKNQYEKNKLNRLENQKKYYSENKEKILKYQKQHTQCECGGEYTNNHKARHLKTQKHIQYIETQKK